MRKSILLVIAILLALATSSYAIADGKKNNRTRNIQQDSSITLSVITVELTKGFPEDVVKVSFSKDIHGKTFYFVLTLPQGRFLFSKTSEARESISFDVSQVEEDAAKMEDWETNTSWLALPDQQAIRPTLSLCEDNLRRLGVLRPKKDNGV